MYHSCMPTNFPNSTLTANGTPIHITPSIISFTPINHNPLQKSINIVLANRRGRLQTVLFVSRIADLIGGWIKCGLAGRRVVPIRTILTQLHSSADDLERAILSKTDLMSPLSLGPPIRLRLEVHVVDSSHCGSHSNTSSCGIKVPTSQ